MRVGKIQNNRLKWVYLFVVATLLFVFDLLGILGFVRRSLELIYQPVALYSLDLSKNVVSRFEYLSRFGTVYNEIDALKNRVSQLEATNLEYELLQEKYSSLLKHSKVASKQYEYIQGEVYISPRNEGILLNVGSEQGIVYGNYAVVGDVYIGSVVKVDSNTSLVRGADDIGSTLEVLIGKSVSAVEKEKFVRAVAVGRNEEILIENIAGGSGVSNGDVVMVADDKGFLMLGKISSVNSDKAASVLTAKVTPAVDIFAIKFIYVRK
ncbi:rod shape-determining protein MreC [bacterium]|nr:rod shape-determining protein MreC [bacterium]